MRTETRSSDGKIYINQISYNPSGAVEKTRLGNGNWETAVYNEMLQITQIGLGHSATDKSLLKIDYGYGTNTENNGSLRQQKVNFTGLANEIVQDYIYDDLNRLKSAEEKVSSVTSWKQTFNYDRYGNRTFDPGNTTTIIDSKATNPQILISDNRFKKDQDGDYVNDYDYDKNGNLILDADNQRYIFDAENRIKELFKSTNGTQTPNATYEYDGEGKRVRKISDGVETVFVYNAGGTLVAEYSTELNPNPHVSYLTADHLGSPRIVTGNDGTVISRHDYMAFGDEVTEKLGNIGGRTNSQGYGEPDDVRKQYTGYERDKESGLDYAQARYYNSNHGRFTSVDPLTASANVKDPQTFNRYTYAMNSPYKFTDPLGLISVTTGACGNFCRNHESQFSEKGGGRGHQNPSKNFDEEPQQQQQQKGYYMTEEGFLVCQIECGDELSNTIELKKLEPLPPPNVDAEFSIRDDGYGPGGLSVTEETGGSTVIGNTVINNYLIRKWNVSLSMQLKDENGNVFDDYEYEVSYNGNTFDEKVNGKQSPENGQAFIGTSKVRWVQFGDGTDESLNPYNSDRNLPHDTDESRSGTITLHTPYGSTAKIRFEVTVKSNETQPGSPIITVTPRTRLQWNHPSK